METAPPLAATTLTATPSSRAAIARAMERRHQIYARHQRRPVRFCPHALGRHEGEPYVLGFMVQPDPDFPAAPGSWRWLRLWQWLRLSDLDEVRAVEGEWLTGPRWSRPLLTFLNEIEKQAR